MKLNISFPAIGCQKTFYEKQMATEVLGDFFGEEWKGYWLLRFSNVSRGGQRGLEHKPYEEWLSDRGCLAWNEGGSVETLSRSTTTKKEIFVSSG
uniref:Uncharacterized protein n=1 Tax=Taeniopygia guttata TaxID=59729 RepID=A0A674GYT4_TAEGU